MTAPAGLPYYFGGFFWSKVAQTSLFMGNSPARIDDKGRLKLPQSYRQDLEARYGRELFLTSLTGEYVRVYPMPVWLDILQKLTEVAPGHPSRERFLDRVNYFGDKGELDAQGRVLVPYRLRDAAGMVGEVDVLGKFNYLDVWNHDRFVQQRIKDNAFTDDDARALAEFGI